MEDMDHPDQHIEDAATKTLNGIAAGGQHLLIVARRRIFEVLDAMEAGDFREAMAAANNLTGVLSPLSHAQTYIGIAEDTQLVPARELAVGMVLAEVGEITEFDVSECSAMSCKGHVKMKVGDEHPMEFRGDQELFVMQSSLPSDGS